MRLLRSFLRDTRHLWFLLFLVAAGSAGFLFLRGKIVPESFGQFGPYRGAALDELAARPSTVQADSVCLDCHAEVGEERAETLHEVVLCIHCHGLGQEHVVAARKAAKSEDSTVPPAAAWDGDFRTSIDLYVSRDRALCLACHKSVVGMPEGFQGINVAEHLEEMGTEEPDSPESCFECHAGHDTAP